VGASSAFVTDAIAEKHYAVSIFPRACIAHEQRDDERRESRDRLAKAFRGL